MAILQHQREHQARTEPRDTIDALIARFERALMKLERHVARIDSTEDRLDRQRRPFGDGWRN